jgi:hypothetical protein
VLVLVDVLALVVVVVVEGVGDGVVVAVVVAVAVVTLGELDSVAEAMPAPPSRRPAVTIVATVVRSARARTSPPFVRPRNRGAHGPIDPSITDRDSTAAVQPAECAPQRAVTVAVHPLGRAPSPGVIRG